MTSTANVTRTRARVRHRRAVDSISVVSYRTGERQGRDPLTGECVAWVDPSQTWNIPVRPEPFLNRAYVWGMPDVPRD